MFSDSPGVVHVVAFSTQCLHQANIIEEPVPGLVVTVTPLTSVVVATVLHKNANRLSFAVCDDVGVVVSAPDIGETADDAQDFSELVGMLPGDGEGGDRTRTRATDAVLFGIR